MTEGPFLYDDGPAPLHTGNPRAGRGWLIFGLLSIVLLSVGMVGGLYLVKGSPGDQATEVTTVFYAALRADDTETAHGLLCERERARLEPGEVAGAYQEQGTPEITSTGGDPVEGASEQQVRVRWSGGGSSDLTIISEDGPRVCGID